ncbi:ATP-binding protein [Pontibacillus salipaludis]|uniref:CRISPR-associated endoribonuclease Cas2 n=1 Tax=Pontibacillus salipaludis TaxID=1697394 RepID=A0ABQ1QFZ3_9BACI|nr:ATP-binding protein [Pontibacillus salipaludis]GGD25787.1 CRISPR-associated endoribonuclease Cas2 [Pontibacillus salipaludis]
MNRYAIITVGKTHSGKSTFAKELHHHLSNSHIIDQDNHATFINTYYKDMLPEEGPNVLKYVVSQSILDYALDYTHDHLILSNANLSRVGRSKLLDQFRQRGVKTILVYFNLPKQVLEERIEQTNRSTDIFRVATTFEEVLERQSVNEQEDLLPPTQSETDHLFVINGAKDTHTVISDICNIAE